MDGNLSIMQILWQAGPVVKLVILLLIAASILSWAIIIKKRKTLKEIRLNNETFMHIYREGSNLKEILKRSSEVPFSAYGVMFDKGYKELVKINERFSGNDKSVQLRDHFSKFGLGVIERALTQGMLEAQQKLDHLQSPLASVGSVSPYIGLFGTVWGIMHSFTGLSQGGASLDAVAPGIAEALVATAIGLAAAIPAVLSFNYFNSESEKVNLDMQNFSQEFLNMVERSVIARNNKTQEV